MVHHILYIPGPVISFLFIQVTMKMSIYYCSTSVFVLNFSDMSIYVYVMACMHQLPLMF